MKLLGNDKVNLRGVKVFGLNPNVFFLGIVSLLTAVSSGMIITLVPLFLANARYDGSY